MNPTFFKKFFLNYSLLAVNFIIKHSRIFNKIFLFNVYATPTLITLILYFQIYNIFFTVILIYLSSFYTILYFFIFKTNQEKLISNIVVKIVLELKNTIALIKSQAEIYKEIQDRIKINKNKSRKGKNLYYIDFNNYISFKKITNMTLNTSKYGLEYIENLLMLFQDQYKTNVVKSFSVKTIIKDAIDICSVLFPEIKKIHINLEDFYIKSNKNYIKYIFVNIIKNSYMHGGRNIKLQIYNNNKIIYIMDNGIGINKEEIKSVFEKYCLNHKGSIGAGLPFCKKVMYDIGGSIKCESIKNKFTKITLDFTNMS